MSRPRTLWLGGLAVVAALALAWLTIVAPRAAGAGWRVGFLFAGSVPIGATVLLLIARLTGATWGAPLVPLSLPVPLLLVAAVPLVLAQGFIAAPDHLIAYMAPAAFGARTFVALAIWCVLGWFAIRGRLSAPGAAGGLLAHGLIVSVLAYDWVLGGDPGQPYSAIGMALATQQIVAATAVACLIGADRGRALDDLWKLMIAGCLGFAYLLFIDWLVVWYGNLPPRVGWYLARMAGEWGVQPPAALVLGLLAPIAAKIFLPRRIGLRVGGGCALAGLWLADSWLVGPRGGALAMIAGAVLATVLIGVSLTIMGARPRARRVPDAA